MSTFVKTIIWINLAILIVLAVTYAHLMISPGPLVDGHQELETDCFACHTPFMGATADNCIVCHKIADIGLRTTKGKPVLKKTTPNQPPKTAVPFHQKLLEQDCTGCHTDHKGVAVYRKNFKFSHDLLAPKTREQCVACHLKPEDKIHEKASETCLTCHVQEKWKPATFKHDQLSKAELQNCVSCHKLPEDKLHENTSDQCADCHQTKAWKPATFSHESLPPAQLRQCVACHAKVRPDDMRHRQASKRCGNCHFTNKWAPAKDRSGLGGQTFSPTRQRTPRQNSPGQNSPGQNTQRPTFTPPSTGGNAPDWWLEQRKKRLNRR